MFCINILILLYANGNVDKGKELLVGLGVGDNNNRILQVEDSSAHHCGCVVYGYGSVLSVYYYYYASLFA